VVFQKDIWLSGPEGQHFKINGHVSTRMGRTDDNDIVLPDSTISLHHAVIFYENGLPFLRDLQSANGTFIDGARVDVGQLRDGAKVSLGRVSLTYREGADTSAVLPLACKHCGHANKNGATFCSRCGKPLTASKRWIAGLVGIVSVLAIVTFSTHAFLSSSNRKPGASSQRSAQTGNMFDAQNDYQLPDASSDFVGDWCGWLSVTACQPEGSCGEPQRPESLSFNGGSGKPVTLHYTVLGSANVSIVDVSVRSQGPRDVRVTFVGKWMDTTARAFVLRDIREDIVSIDSNTIEDTDLSTNEADSSDTETQTAQLHKCTDEFLQAQDEWQKQHDENNAIGAVDGNVN
jgi:hypothetical protein